MTKFIKISRCRRPSPFSYQASTRFYAIEGLRDVVSVIGNPDLERMGTVTGTNKAGLFAHELAVFRETCSHLSANNSFIPMVLLTVSGKVGRCLFTEEYLECSYQYISFLTAHPLVIYHYKQLCTEFQVSNFESQCEYQTDGTVRRVPAQSPDVHGSRTGFFY